MVVTKQVGPGILSLAYQRPVSRHSNNKCTDSKKRFGIGGVVFLLAFCNILNATYLAPYNKNNVRDDEAAIMPTLGLHHPVRHKTKTLVTTQLPGLKSHHYKNYLGPSWRRLVQERRNTDTSAEAVLPDLFIACVDEACDQIDHEHCFRLDITNNATHDRIVWRSILMDRPEDEMLCYFADVPMKANEEYVFLHSVNYLEMEPFLSILDLYDYILRTDADAILFPGLLHLAPTNSDGWIGAGYYGEETTHHLVRYASKKFLPELGEPLRSATVTPSMQSTFYVSSSKISKFVRTLILATGTLYRRAFDKKYVCPELTKLNITQQLLSKQYDTVGDVCKWPTWHRGISSLYGTRIAVDYVLENVTVTQALDALATKENSDDQLIDQAIQVHLLNTKKVADSYAPGIDICLAPREAVKNMRSLIAENNAGLTAWSDVLLNAMENITQHSTIPATIHHRTAEVFLNMFREQHGCNSWPFYDMGDPKTRENGEKEITAESYEAILKEIEWAKEKALTFQKDTEVKEKLEEEYDMLAKHPVVIDSLDQFCGNCVFSNKALCSERKEYLIEEYNLDPLLAHFQVVNKHPQCRVEKLDDKEKEEMAKWCGDCFWFDKTTCDSRKDHLNRKYMMQPKLARLEVMKDTQCQKTS